MVNRTLTTRTLGGTVLHHRRPYSYESTEDADENASLDITRMRRETSMRRARTMVRLDRCKTRDPLMRKRTVAAPLTRAGATTNHFNRELGERSNVPPHAALTAYTTPLPPPENDSSWWTTMSRCLTCCAVPRVLERTMGMKDRVVQQAWREKVALCIIIAMLCTIVGFLTVGLRPALCPANDGRTSSEPYLNQTDGTVNNFGYDSVVIKGGVYPFDRVREVVMGAGGNDIDDSWRGRDVSWLMNGNSGDPCSELAGVGWDVGRLKGDCRREGLGGTTGRCLEWTKVAPLLPPPRTRLFFSWSELAKSKQFPHQLLAFNGLILNLTDLNTLFPSWNTTPLGTIVHKSLGSDSSYLLLTRPDSRVLAQCLVHHFAVGYVDREGSGCAVYQTISIFLLLVVVGVVLAKFLMGVVFYWVWGEGRGGVQWRWGAVSRFSPRERALRVQLQQQEQMLHHQKMLTQQQQQMWYTNESGEMMPNTYGYPAHGPSSSYIPVTTGFPPPAAPSQEMYTLLLVTCYSESAQGIRTTLESLAETTYPDDKKLLFVIADGLIKGDDWKELGMTTPEVIVEMLTGWEEPEPKSYLAIADGERQHNMAKVYAGYFSSTGHTVPTILVVKCGTPSESSSAKPGNRGKRDSQLILMNFFSRVLFDDRMTPLDHELYNAIQRVTHGAPAESFEAVLMVDADTRVGPSSLGYMVDALVTDDQIMGLCGETRIANKRDSWVTMIQVFEYYISHHSGKAFESVFGGVTCLPGCFCMYRIKAIKPNGLVVPLLVNPDIVDEYSENVLDTLHKKNLLLLGEDRFLSTLLLRQFPKRKMVFVPRAVCHTVVPDTLAVLTSQRRRWINSTVHNLLELVKVKELCGIFCFSMQFVVALDLFSTAVLPAALLFMYVLIITAIAGQGATLPLAMLLVSLLLPAVLITLTTRKWVYVGWMGVYLLALPVWNFMLPLYAFWHFDDFSWGETRKVEGDDGGHGGTSGTFEVGSVHLKRYSDWEAEALGDHGGDGSRQSEMVSVSHRPQKPLPQPPSLRDPYEGGASHINYTQPASYYTTDFANYDGLYDQHGLTANATAAVLLSPTLSPVGLTDQQRRSWYLDQQRRRRDVSSMPPGQIRLEGWIDEDDHSKGKLSIPTRRSSLKAGPVIPQLMLVPPTPWSEQSGDGGFPGLQMESDLSHVGLKMQNHAPKQQKSSDLSGQSRPTPPTPTPTSADIQIHFSASSSSFTHNRPRPTQHHGSKALTHERHLKNGVDPEKENRVERRPHGPRLEAKLRKSDLAVLKKFWHQEDEESHRQEEDDERLPPPRLPTKPRQVVFHPNTSEQRAVPEVLPVVPAVPGYIQPVSYTYNIKSSALRDTLQARSAHLLSSIGPTTASLTRTGTIEYHDPPGEEERTSLPQRPPVLSLDLDETLEGEFVDSLATFDGGAEDVSFGDAVLMSTFVHEEKRRGNQVWHQELRIEDDGKSFSFLSE